MPPLEASGWKRFKAASKAKPPALYHHYAPRKGGLLLQMTDLVSVWQCDLSRSKVITKASEQHCSIDPSESTDQLNVFLSKLEQSLQQGNNILAKGGSAEEDDLLLRTQTSLPQPLPSLAFTFTLQMQGPAQFSSSILQPLLRSLAALQNQVASLEDAIKAKDHVISKLLDRITNQAVDMSMIFPTLTGIGGRKGNVTIDMAKQRIPGMEVFDHDVWIKEFEQEGSAVKQVGDLIRGSERAVQAVHDTPDWIKQLPGPDVLERANQHEIARRASQSQSQSRDRQAQGSDAETASEDEFERQATPPSLRKKRQSPERGRKGSDSSQSSSAEHSPPPAKKQKTAKIRGIGQRKLVEKPQPTNDSTSSPAVRRQKSPSPRRQEADDSDATETGSSSSESDAGEPPKTERDQKSKLGGLQSRSKTPTSPTARNSSPAPPPRPTSSYNSTPSRRLGRLGKSQQRTVTASPAPEDKQPSSPATPSHRLGRIGIKKQIQSPIPEFDQPDAATASEDDDLDTPITKPRLKKNTALPEARPRPSSKRSKTPEVNHEPPAPEPSPKPVETEDQKAARKKEELRKTIASGPAKKKRRL